MTNSTRTVEKCQLNTLEVCLFLHSKKSKSQTLWFQPINKATFSAPFCEKFWILRSLHSPFVCSTFIVGRIRNSIQQRQGKKPNQTSKHDHKNKILCAEDKSSNGIIIAPSLPRLIVASEANKGRDSLSLQAAPNLDPSDFYCNRLPFFEAQARATLDDCWEFNTIIIIFYSFQLFLWYI